MEPILLTEPVRTAGLAATIADVYDTLRAMVEGVLAWSGSFYDVITANYIILIPILFALVGLGVGLLRRLTNL